MAENQVGQNEAHSDGSGGGEEGQGQTGSKLDDFLQVAAQAHQEDHGWDEVALDPVLHTGNLFIHRPQAGAVQHHSQNINDDDSGNVLEDFAGIALGQIHDQSGTNKNIC